MDCRFRKWFNSKRVVALRGGVCEGCVPSVARAFGPKTAPNLDPGARFLVRFPLKSGTSGGAADMFSAVPGKRIPLPILGAKASA